MRSVSEQIASFLPKSGLLATRVGQHVALGVVTSVLAGVPFLLDRPVVTGIGQLMSFIGILIAGWLYLERSEPEVSGDIRDLVIISALVVGVVWATWVYGTLGRAIPLAAMPVALGAVLGALLVSPRVGMLLALISAMAGALLGVHGGVSLVAALMTSIVGVAVLVQISDRTRLIGAATALTAASGVSQLASALATGATLHDAIRLAGLGSLGGIVTVVAMLGLLPIFEIIFGVTTDVRLLELASPASPLMRRLMMEAPGTYAHAILTGNLAESAAEAIGANPLLARVGAYYHDIGKIRRPTFFAENQVGCDNPHDNTSPSLSALIITAHVREGVELATEYHLPREVVDIVRQHHGTSMVSYFYQKAAAAGEAVVEADFRYTGELPASREAAIVMLADAAEAAVRATRKPTPPRIEETVRRVVMAKLEDHQLDHADLTFADVERIIGVYARMLANIHHTRIEYPEATARRHHRAGQRHEP